MTLSTFAMILGVSCYLFGFPLLFSDQGVVLWRKKVLRDPVLVRLLGGTFCVIGALTLLHRYEFTPDAEGLLVVLAWFTLIKGAIVAWWPEAYAKWRLTVWEEHMLGNPSLQVFTGLLTIVCGAVFTYLSVILLSAV